VNDAIVETRRRESLRYGISWNVEVDITGCTIEQEGERGKKRKEEEEKEIGE
jgi:hypothetical protein